MFHLNYFWIWKYYSQHFADGNNFVPYVTPAHRQVSSWKDTFQRKIDLQAILRNASDQLKLYLEFLIMKSWKNWHFSPKFFNFWKNLWLVSPDDPSNPFRDFFPASAAHLNSENKTDSDYFREKKLSGKLLARGEPGYKSQSNLLILPRWILIGLTRKPGLMPANQFGKMHKSTTLQNFATFETNFEALRNFAALL